MKNPDTGTSPFSLDVPKLLAEYGEQLLARVQAAGAGQDPRAVFRDFVSQYAAEFQRSQERGVRGSAHDYNVWMARLFEVVDSGSSYQELIQVYLDEIANLIEEKKSDTLFAVVIEQVTDGRQAIGYRVGPRCGDIHDTHWFNFASNISSLEKSVFLDQLFAQDGGLPLLLASWIEGYDGIFNSFVRSATGRWSHDVRASDFWLTAVSLLADKDDEPRRILFVAYRNIGSSLIPNPGKGAALETRVLDVLRIAYGQIDRQSQALARYLVDERSDIIKSLYPAIYAHDFKAPLANIKSQTLLVLRASQDLAVGLLEGSDTDALLEAVIRSLRMIAGLLRQVTRLHDYLATYASLDVVSDQPWLLHDGLHTVAQLFDTRASHEGVHIDMPKRPSVRLQKGYALQLDQGMFIVVLVNLLQNAINMMVHTSKTQLAQGQKRRVELRIERDVVRHQLLLWVGNTDTEIAPENRERIFKKGFSTRGGSGTGLYLCRRIAAHWGGALVLCGEAERRQHNWADAFQVVFRLNLPLPPLVKKAAPKRKNKEAV